MRGWWGHGGLGGEATHSTVWGGGRATRSALGSRGVVGAAAPTGGWGRRNSLGWGDDDGMVGASPHKGVWGAKPPPHGLYDDGRELDDDAVMEPTTAS